MEVHKSKKTLAKNLAIESSLTPSVSVERKDGITRRSQTREVNSRYRSPSPSVTRSGTPARQSVPKRPISAERKCPSTPPSSSVTRSGSPARQSVPKRLISVERKHLSTPPSPPPPRPSTPVQDTELDTRWASRKLNSNKLPEGLWPSTIRSLSVSFQSDVSPHSILKKDKPVPKSLSDHALRTSSKVCKKPAETQIVTRKVTPERKNSPLKGKNAHDQLQFSSSKDHNLKGKKESEISKPVNILHSRPVEQHRWPGISGGNLPSSPLTRSTDLTDRNTKTRSLRRMSIPDGLSKPLKKTPSDVQNLSSLNESVSSCLLRKTKIVTPGAKSQSLPTTPGGSRASSPSKAPVSRGVSPSRTRAMSSTSRGVSPAHSRPSSPCRQSNNSSTSVLSFIADIKKGKKAVNHLEDAHELRLLYNRHLQWRYANARANAVLHSQKVKAERMLFNMLETISELWDYVTEKKNDLHQLRLRIKLHTVLREQIFYLEGWSSCESEHINALSHAVEDLRLSILHLPVTGGARGDIESVKAAVSSAVDLMQAMGSSISSILARVEVMNSLVSDLADVAAQGSAMIDGCEALLVSIAALQAEEDSLRTHLIQLKEN